MNETTGEVHSDYVHTDIGLSLAGCDIYDSLTSF